jgi:DNA primase
VAAAAQDAHAQRERSKPKPALYRLDDWPAVARLWLFRAGLSRQDAGKLGAYYHPPTNRVVLQLREDFWVARSTDGRQPKYLSGDRPPDLLLKWGSAAVPTLCEDALSAYKVGKVAEGWPIMGTKVSPAVCAALLQRGAPVNLWLDPDAAGQRAASKYRRQLQAYGLTVRNIVSQRDPKLHTLDEIRTILEHTK